MNLQIKNASGHKSLNYPSTAHPSSCCTWWLRDQVVLSLMYDDCFSNDVFRLVITTNTPLICLECNNSIASFICFKVSDIPFVVACFTSPSTMWFKSWIPMTTCRFSISRWAISKFVEVNGVQTWSKPWECSFHNHNLVHFWTANSTRNVWITFWFCFYKNCIVIRTGCKWKNNRDVNRKLETKVRSHSRWIFSNIFNLLIFVVWKRK